MTAHDLRNILYVMRSIDAWEFPAPTPHWVDKFIESPFETFIRMGDKRQAIVWAIIKKRMQVTDD